MHHQKKTTKPYAQHGKSKYMTIKPLNITYDIKTLAKQINEHASLLQKENEAELNAGSCFDYEEAQSKQRELLEDIDYYLGELESEIARFKAIL